MTEYLKVRDIYMRFGFLNVLTGVNFAAEENERHALIGPNGAGKTTLFNIISGKFKPTSGNIFLKGEDVSGKPPHLLSQRGVSRSFQITNIFKEMSVFDNIMSGVRSHYGMRFNFIRRPEKDPRFCERTEAILEDIGLSGVKNRIASSLSYGQQRALEIGIVLSTNPDLILLDEPTAGMTREETEHAIRMINRVTKNKTLIIIEHDMDVVFSLADRISVLHYGQIIASDIPDMIKNDQRVKDAYLGEEG